MNILRTLARSFAFQFWFGFVFALSLWVTLPWSRVRDQIMIRAADAGVSVLIGKLGPTPFGVRARDLSIGPVDGGPESTAWVNLDGLRVGSGPLGLFRAMRAAPALIRREDGAILQALAGLDIDAELLGGELAVDIDPADGGAHILLDGEDLDLSRKPLEFESFRAAPTGMMTVKGDVVVVPGDPKKSEGTIDLQFADLVLKGLAVQGFDMPEATFTKATLGMKIVKGRADFRETVFESDVVTAYVEGTITLGQDLRRSRYAVRIRFKLKDDLDAGFKLVAGMNGAHRDDEGYWHYQLNGTVERPRFRPSPAGARKSGSSTTSRRPKAKGAAADEEPEVVGDEEPVPGGAVTDEDPSEMRARLKEERMKRREERKKKREELQRLREERAQDRATRPAPDPIDGAPIEEDFERSNGPVEIEPQQDPPPEEPAGDEELPPEEE